MAALADKRAKAFYDRLGEKLKHDPLLTDLRRVPGNQEVAETIERQYNRSLSDRLQVKK